MSSIKSITYSFREYLLALVTTLITLIKFINEAALLERFAIFFKMMASEGSYNKVKAYLLLDYKLNPALESELLKLDNIINEYMTQSFIKRMNK